MILELKFVLFFVLLQSISNLCLYAPFFERKIEKPHALLLHKHTSSASQCVSVLLCLYIVSVSVIWAKAGRNTFAHMCANKGSKCKTHTHTHTRYGSGSLAAPSLLWKTSCLWAPEEMTALSLISLSSAQTSPNYSRCLPLRWHAHWIIDGRPAPVSLKASPTGTTAASGQDTCQRGAARLPCDSSLDYYSNSNLFSLAARC